MRLTLAPIFALLAACGSQVDDRDTATTASVARSPASERSGSEHQVIVAELFTSQGCSSCPPADRLLSSIGELAGEVDVIPLAFHVDYWNDLGWRDPFSTADWTERQQRYAAAISGGRVYTPMMVVQGSAHMVGSSQGEISAAIARASRADPGGAAIAGRSAGADRLTVEATAGDSAAGAWVALVESGLDTEVARGENRGRVLHNDFIVRRLVRAFDLAPHQRKTETVAVGMDPAWRRDRLSLALFLQDPGTMAIRAASRATLDP